MFHLTTRPSNLASIGLQATLSCLNSSWALKQQVMYVQARPTMMLCFHLTRWLSNPSASLPSPARSSSEQLTLAAAAAAADADAGAPCSIQTARGMAQDQQQPWAAAAPALLVPLPARRRLITADDVLKAYPEVEKKWIPIRDCVPPVEDTYYKYTKEVGDADDEDACLVKRQTINSANHLGNKRREICYYLPTWKKHAALLDKLENELQGLEHQLHHRIADLRIFMPDSTFVFPDHFNRFPELIKPVPKKAKKAKK